VGADYIISIKFAMHAKKDLRFEVHVIKSNCHLKYGIFKLSFKKFLTTTRYQKHCWSQTKQKEIVRQLRFFFIYKNAWFCCQISLKWTSKQNFLSLIVWKKKQAYCRNTLYSKIFSHSFSYVWIFRMFAIQMGKYILASIRYSNYF